MRAFVLPALLAATVFAGEVDVRSTAAGRISLRVSSAPLSDVLDRIARQTGMKVIYDGPPPRALVRERQFDDATPADAVTNVLEGLGVSYALRLDATGSRVDTLLVLGAPGAPAPPAVPAAPRALVPRLPGMRNPPPADDGDDEASPERLPEEQRPRENKEEPARPAPLGMPAFPPPVGPINPLTMPTPVPAPSPTPPPQ